jgi:hypothetical protein
VPYALRISRVVDLIHFHIEREGNVVAHHFEPRLVQQVDNVVLAAGEVVVDTQHVAVVSQQSFTQMRAQKSGATGDQNAFSGCDSHVDSAKGRYATADTAIVGRKLRPASLLERQITVSGRLAL